MAPAQSIAKFLLEEPLYSSITLDNDEAYFLYSSRKIDGYCPICERDTTFEMSPASVPRGEPWNNIPARVSFDSMSITCVREPTHKIRFHFKINRMTVQKIGQFPSLADIAISELKQKYKTVLKGDNWSELYKAIGLATHGEGIGAFVYLRRVFENLIFQRFYQYMDAEKWKEEDFRNLRMNERVAFLKGHLPDFLVENSKIYSIFSKGIHELENEDCLKFFEVGKSSILIILEEDLKIKEDLERRAKFKKEIAEFGGEEAA